MPTHPVAAAVYIQIRRERNTANEKEERIESIRRNHKERRDGEILVDGRGDQVE